MIDSARILAAVLALSASGCSLVVDPAKSDPLRTAEGFCNSYQDAAVSFYGRCLAYAESYLDPTFAAFRYRCDNLQATVSSGRLRYVEDAGRRCIAAIAAGGCNSPGIYYPPPDCADAIQPSVAAGSYCDSGSNYDECIGSAACYNPDGTTCGSAICVSPGLQNQPCDPLGRCVDNTWCSNGSPRTCVPTNTYGATCGFVGGTNYGPCDDRYYYCNSAGGNVCASAPGLNQRCDTAGYSCQRGYGCSFNPADSFYYCRTPAALGQFCADRPCQNGLFCDARPSTPVCADAKPAPRGVGGDCYALGSQACREGLHCNVTYTCEANLAEGAPCDGMPYDACGAGAACVKRDWEPYSSLKCVHLKAPGGPCRTGAYDCQQGLWCSGAAPYNGNTADAGTCHAPAGASAICGYPYNDGVYSYQQVSCAVGYYCDWPSGNTGTCRAYLGEGASCITGQCNYSIGLGCDSTDPANPVCRGPLSCNAQNSP